MTTFVIFIFWLCVLNTTLSFFQTMHSFTFENLLNFVGNGAVCIWAAKVLGW